MRNKSPRNALSGAVAKALQADPEPFATGQAASCGSAITAAFIPSSGPASSRLIVAINDGIASG
jgi:hypothetical protein